MIEIFFYHPGDLNNRDCNLLNQKSDQVPGNLKQNPDYQKLNLNLIAEAESWQPKADLLINET